MKFYSKVGAGSRHAWQLSTASISSLLFVVRAYEGIGNRNSFWSIHSTHAKLQADTGHCDQGLQRFHAGSEEEIEIVARAMHSCRDNLENYNLAPVYPISNASCTHS